MVMSQRDLENCLIVVGAVPKPAPNPAGRQILHQRGGVGQAQDGHASRLQLRANDWNGAGEMIHSVMSGRRQLRRPPLIPCWKKERLGFVGQIIDHVDLGDNTPDDLGLIDHHRDVAAAEDLAERIDVGVGANGGDIGADNIGDRVIH